MIYVNNFRYGKISKKMAGRFDAEQYNQGAFTFRNCRSLFEGGVTRRPPLRHLEYASGDIISYINANGEESLEQNTEFNNVRTSKIKIYVTKGFTVSSTISYLLCLGTRTYTGHTEDESMFVCYRFNKSGSSNTFDLVAIGSLANIAVSSETKDSQNTSVILSEDICSKICFAQYYDRMYVASHEFKTFYFEHTDSLFKAELKDFIFYNDAKGKMKMVAPSSSRSDAGKIIFAHEENVGQTSVIRYYYNTLYRPEDLCVGITQADIEDPSDAYVSGFNDYSDNEFNHCKNNYPSIVAIVNDCLWMANTKANPNAIWKSRVLGTSQWIEGYHADTLHDFSPFQVVSTQTAKLLEVDEWPLTAMRDSNGNYMYHQYGGADMWYTTRDFGTGDKSYDMNPANKLHPHRTNGQIDYYMDASENNGGEPYYLYNDDHRLVREGKPWIQYGAGKVYRYTKWYTDSSKETIQTDPSKWSEAISVSEVKVLNMEWETKDDGPRNYLAIKKNGNVDPDATSYKQGLISDGMYWYDKVNKLYWTASADNATPNETYGLAHWYDSYDWFKYKISLTQNSYTVYTYGSKDERFKYILVEEPVRHKYETYDMTTGTQLSKMDTTIDVVATDSCSIRMELNTGKEDAVRFIKAGCDKVIIGTTNAEWTLPAGFNAVSNYSASRYSGYGSLVHEPIELNRSIIFLQRGNLLREFYLYQSYLMQRDVTAFNHSAIGNCGVIDTIAKNAPDPTLYVVRDDGTILYGMYEADEGLNSFADWDIGDSSYKFKNVSVIERDGEEVVIALVNKKVGESTEQFICYFDEGDVTEWADEIQNGKLEDYTTEIETSYIEINNQNLMFGRNKKTKGVWMRPYESGRVYIGNDRRQMTLTNYALGNSDYHAPVTGKADMSFSMWLKSYRSEPMTILAFAWEVEQ